MMLVPIDPAWLIAVAAACACVALRRSKLRAGAFTLILIACLGPAVERAAPTVAPEPSTFALLDDRTVSMHTLPDAQPIDAAAQAMPVARIERRQLLGAHSPVVGALVDLLDTLPRGAHVVLHSDGRDTTGQSFDRAIARAQARAIRVHTPVWPSGSTRRSAPVLVATAAPDDAPFGTPMTITAAAAPHPPLGRVRWRVEADGSTLATRTVDHGSRPLARTTMVVRPPAATTSVRVVAQADDGRTFQAAVPVRVRAEPLRVLLVVQSPSWNAVFAARAWRADAGVACTVLTLHDPATQLPAARDAFGASADPFATTAPGALAGYDVIAIFPGARAALPLVIETGSAVLDAAETAPGVIEFVPGSSHAAPFWTELAASMFAPPASSGAMRVGTLELEGDAIPLALAGGSAVAASNVSPVRRVLRIAMPDLWRAWRRTPDAWQRMLRYAARGHDVPMQPDPVPIPPPPPSPSALERAEPEPRRGALERLAAQTGGVRYDPADPGALARAIEPRDMPATRAERVLDPRLAAVIAAALCALSWRREEARDA